MTRRHFVKLAEEIKKISELSARFQAANAVCRAAKCFNPSFDVRRFLDACNA